MQLHLCGRCSARTGYFHRDLRIACSAVKTENFRLPPGQRQHKPAAIRLWRRFSSCVDSRWHGPLSHLLRISVGIGAIRLANEPNFLRFDLMPTSAPLRSPDGAQRNPGYENSVKKAPKIEHCCCPDGSRIDGPYCSSDKRRCLHAPDIHAALFRHGWIIWIVHPSKGCANSRQRTQYGRFGD